MDKGKGGREKEWLAGTRVLLVRRKTSNSP